MDSYSSASARGSTISHGYTQVSGSYSIGSGSSNSHGKSETWTTSVIEDNSYGYAGTPYRSYAGDPETVARCIFQDDMRDALARLKRSSALQGAEARVWCIAELQRFLLELLTDDVA